MVSRTAIKRVKCADLTEEDIVAMVTTNARYFANGESPFYAVLIGYKMFRAKDTRSLVVNACRHYGIPGIGGWIMKNDSPFSDLLGVDDERSHQIADLCKKTIFSDAFQNASSRDEFIRVAGELVQKDIDTLQTKNECVAYGIVMHAILESIAQQEIERLLEQNNVAMPPRKEMSQAMSKEEYEKSIGV